MTTHKQQADAIQIFSDGACRGNPGPGGWGALLRYREHEKTLHGGEPNTTNNRMELTAILRAMQKLPDGAEATIFSDSQYCVNGLTVWKNGWKRRNWMKQGKAIPNRDLWMLLDAQQCRVRARFEWVRGHDGNPGNERADRMAEAARESISQA
jgi:ribonuclease HI